MNIDKILNEEISDQMIKNVVYAVNVVMLQLSSREQFSCSEYFDNI